MLYLLLANGTVHLAAVLPNGQHAVSEACNTDQAKGNKLFTDTLPAEGPKRACRRCLPNGLPMASPDGTYAIDARPEAGEGMAAEAEPQGIVHSLEAVVVGKGGAQHAG